MNLKFTNVVKGVTSQDLLKTLLEDGGYRVVRFGVEELFSEIKHLDVKQYLGLNLPLQVRYLPDFLVADLDMKSAFLVEVKFRSRFDERTAELMHGQLTEQRKHWPTCYAVIMVAEPLRPNGKFHQDYIRILPPNETDMLVDKKVSLGERWESLHQLQRVFKAFNNAQIANEIQKNADKITNFLRNLTDVD